MVKTLLRGKEFGHKFGNNKKYHYIAVTKTNALLVKLLSNHDGDEFSVTCLSIFQNEELLRKH